ncbi:MAG: hypothetical protein ACPG59_06375 [Flavobacteriaceae bacterium]
MTTNDRLFLATGGFRVIFAWHGNDLLKTMPSSKRLVVTKEPRWMKYAGAILVLVGSFALIPFKVDYLEMFDLPMYLLGMIGVILLVRAAQKIGWHLVLEGNVLYYSKFNMYASWKRIRSQEFALSQDKITKVIVTPVSITFHYEPGRILTFSTIGLNNVARERLLHLERALQPQA